MPVTADIDATRSRPGWLQPCSPERSSPAHRWSEGRGCRSSPEIGKLGIQCAVYILCAAAREQRPSLYGRHRKADAVDWPRPASSATWNRNDLFPSHKHARPGRMLIGPVLSIKIRCKGIFSRASIPGILNEICPLAVSFKLNGYCYR